MRAMIFAAGLGTRLRPWTEHHPKALVPVGGVPMLQRVIERLKGVDISEMVVNVHHYADQVEAFLRAHDDFGCTIHISDERERLLDTGGGILAARRWLDGAEDFVVHNADILTDCDLRGMIASHRATGSAATLLVAERETSRYLLMDQSMRMHGWINVLTGQTRPDTIDTAGLRRYAFGGVHVLSASIFPSLAAYRGEGEPFSITDYYIDTCRRQIIEGYVNPTPYMWHDIGKPASLAAAEAACQSASTKE